MTNGMENLKRRKCNAAGFNLHVKNVSIINHRNIHVNVSIFLEKNTS